MRVIEAGVELSQRGLARCGVNHSLLKASLLPSGSPCCLRFFKGALDYGFQGGVALDLAGAWCRRRPLGRTQLRHGDCPCQAAHLNAEVPE